MISQQLRQLNVYCRHLHFLKIGDELKCCVFISRECTYIGENGVRIIAMIATSNVIRSSLTFHVTMTVITFIR